MTIAIALLGFNDLGRSVTPTFLFRNRFYLQLSSHCAKMNKNINMGSLKKIQNFRPRDIESRQENLAILRLEGAFAKCQLVL